jgi:uncharacterized protein (DUF433 family)
MHERIVVDPAIHFGKPCVQDTRIPVENVLELIREDIDFAEIVENYYPESIKTGIYLANYNLLKTPTTFLSKGHANRSRKAVSQ